MSHKTQRHAHRNGAAGKGKYPSLADIVRQETNGGRLVVRFLMSAMQGNLEDAKPHHRLDAARQLLKLGADDAQLYVAQHGLGNGASNRRNGRNANHASNGRNGPNTPLNRELADFMRLQTKGGRAAVRFLVDVMRGKLEGFKPHHRLSAAKELLRLCQDDEPVGHDDDQYDEHGLWRGPTYTPIERQHKAPRRRRGTMRKDDNHVDSTPVPKDDGADKTAAPADTVPALERDGEQAEAAGPAPAQSDGETAEPPADRDDGPNAPQQRDARQPRHDDMPWYKRKTLPDIPMDEYYANWTSQRRDEPEEPRPSSAEPSYYELKAMRKGHDIWRAPAEYWISADVNQPRYQPTTRIDSTYFPRGP